MFPIMLNIHGRKCTVAGGGNVAERKVKTLLKYGADVTAVSPVFKDRFPNVKRLEKEYSSSDIENSTCNPPYKRTVSRFNRNCRYLSLRVHFARSLRCYRTRLYRQRQDFTAFSKSVGGLCKSRCGYCCTVGYDGRTSRRNTSST